MALLKNIVSIFKRLLCFPKRAFLAIRFDLIIISVITIILSSFWMPSIPSAKDLISNSKEVDYITVDFLQRVMANGKEPQESDYITIVDIGDISNRNEIGKIMESIYSLNPYKIGVDIDFRLPQGCIYDSLLCAVVENTKDKTVYASALKDYLYDKNIFESENHSFFADANHTDLFIKGLSEGYANLKNSRDRKSVNKFSKCERRRDTTAVSFASKLADENEMEFGDFIIDYVPTDFHIVTPDAITEELIENNIVLLGSTSSNGDLYETPLGILPGLVIHAYIIQTIVEGNDIRELPEYLDIIISIIIGVLYIMILLFIDFFISHSKHVVAAHIVQSGLVTFGMTYIAILILGAVSYWMFTELSIYAPMKHLINSILVTSSIVKVGYSSLIYLMCHYKWLQIFTNKSSYNTLL